MTEFFFESSGLQLCNDTNKMSPQLKSFFFHCHMYIVYGYIAHPGVAGPKIKFKFKHRAITILCAPIPHDKCYCAVFSRAYLTE
jgi:hypothetical protein